MEQLQRSKKEMMRLSKKSRQRSLLFVILFAVVLSASACSKKAPEELLIDGILTETLYLRADGSVQSAYREDFDKSYYDVSELRDFMEDMIAEYNLTAEKDAVKLGEVQAADRVVCAIVEYEDLAAYSDFNATEESKKQGGPAEEVSVEDAQNRYGNLGFTDNKKKVARSGSEVLNAKKHKVVVLRTPIELRTASDILYYSGGNLIDSRTIQITDASEEVVIIYKK